MANRNDRDDPKPTGFSSLDGWQVAFGVAACSGLIFYINGPAQNLNQTLFRLGVMGVGLIGLTVVTILKVTRPKPDDRDDEDRSRDDRD